jgi:hypothetical protein
MDFIYESREQRAAKENRRAERLFMADKRRLAYLEKKKEQQKELKKKLLESKGILGSAQTTSTQQKA